ncbi:MAG: hypothetical protein OJF50_002838 [Nitrospira sp.]|nr:hypothetical protein [Nitrospira sp.]
MGVIIATVNGDLLAIFGHDNSSWEPSRHLKFAQEFGPDSSLEHCDLAAV